MPMSSPLPSPFARRIDRHYDAHHLYRLATIDRSRYRLAGLRALAVKHVDRPQRTGDVDQDLGMHRMICASFPPRPCTVSRSQ